MKVHYGVLVIALLTFAGGTADASEEHLPGSADVLAIDPVGYHAAFERLKRLEGVWEEAEYGRIVEYHLTGKGSALIEEFVGDPPMASVYHLDGEDLRLTHYCNAGNQPRMKAAHYDGSLLRFAFEDVTNLSAPNAYHTRTLDIDFQDDDRVVLSFVGLKDGREIATTHTLTRRSTPPDRSPVDKDTATGGKQ